MPNRPVDISEIIGTRPSGLSSSRPVIVDEFGELGEVPSSEEMSETAFQEHLDYYTYNLMPRSLAETNPKLFKAVMKRRHLNSHERQRLHKPKSDWVETPSGEICKSAETLVVKDIVSKYCK